jgi:GPN-loop GTPase
MLFVQGPAGSGKSTYCHVMQEHGQTLSRRRNIHVANLDPAAEVFKYRPTFDVRDLVSVPEVMDELGLGPNGALLYCMEYLLQHSDWLRDELDSFGDDEYLILDCPGQIELYTHVPLMRNVVDLMRSWGYDGTMVGVFCVDAGFLLDAEKFLSGSLLSLSAMIALELPHINVLTKCDMMGEEEVERILDYSSASHLWNVEQNRRSLLPTRDEFDDAEDSQISERQRYLEARRRSRHRLTDSICQLLDDWQMVSFLPFNIKDEESIDVVLSAVDHAIQYGEDLDVRGADGSDEVDADDGDDGDNE